MCWTIWPGHPPTLAQLAQRLAMPKTTLMRLLAAMQRAGFVAATPVERGYVPGPQAGALALATLRASATRAPAERCWRSWPARWERPAT